MTKQPPKKRTIGRPTKYTKKMANAICEELANGRSLRSVCQDEGMPDKSQVFRWLRIYPSFRDQYARAKEASLDALAEEILDIADDNSGDVLRIKTVKDARTGQIIEVKEPDRDFAARSQLRIEARKWLMAKIMPKKYGDRLDVENSGEQKLIVETRHATDNN